MSRVVRWTNESVLGLAGTRDPVEVITEKARELVVKAMDAGWTGPPFDPIALATQFLHLEVVATDEVLDARTVPTKSGARIEFNPNRPRERRRYSVAHEIAHTLFPDCTDRVRHRGSHHAEVRSNDWQLETLCNIAAAEILMPVGSLAEQSPSAFTIDLLKRARPKFDLSMEAVLLRAAQVANFPCAVFAASRIETGANHARYRIDYAMTSHQWGSPAFRGLVLPAQSVVGECTAIGFTAKADEAWEGHDDDVHVECIGIPAFPGSSYPRVAGLLVPKSLRTHQAKGINYVTGDVLQLRGSGAKVLVHVVNDKTANWGGKGVASAIRTRWPEVQRDFQRWAAQSKENLRLGHVRCFDLERTLTVASVIGQHGYGASSTPRIRYTAINSALKKVGLLASERGASIHMPRIGTGYGGGVWAVIQEIIQSTLSSVGIPVTVYDLPGATARSLFDSPECESS